MENFEAPHLPGENRNRERVQPRKSPGDSSRNAHASNIAKREAAGFGVVLATRKP